MYKIPAVSIVIPFFNKGPFIARTLNSVLTQSFHDFEVIVVNDGSTDDGIEVIKGFRDPRIRLIQQVNLGVSAARNRGVKESKAELIAFLDADDEWFPSHLETLLRLRNNFPDGGAYATAYIIKEENRKNRLAKFKAIPPKPWEGVIPSYFKANALGDYPISSSSVGIPRSIFDEMGGFQIGAFYGEDEDLWGRIALKYPIVFSWNVGAIYHRDATNRVCKEIIPPKTPFVIRAQKMIQSNIVSEKILTDLKEYLVKEEINRANWYAFSGKTQEATIILRDCHPKQLIWKKYKVILITKIPVPVFQSIVMIKRKIINLWVCCIGQI